MSNQNSNILCEYGCNKIAKFKLKSGKWCCESYPNKCIEVRKKNSAGLKRFHESGDGYKFNDEDRKKSNEKQILKAIKKAFVKNSDYSNEFIKPHFIKHFGIKEECNICRLTDWLNKPITLELDHIDGDNKNNLVQNLRLLCPNCHSQTDTFRGRNINTGKKIISDDVLVKAIKDSINIRQALLKVGLSPKGANYQRVKKLKEKFKFN